MMLIPSTATFEQKETFGRLGKPVTKTIKVLDGPDPVSFIWMSLKLPLVSLRSSCLKLIIRHFDSQLWGKFYKYSPTDKHPMIHVTWLIPLHTLSGQVNNSLRRRSGSMQLEVDQKVRNTLGEILLILAKLSIVKIPLQSNLYQQAVIHLMVIVCMIWRAMSGNGALIGMVKITIVARSHVIPRAAFRQSPCCAGRFLEQLYKPPVCSYPLQQLPYDTYNSYGFRCVSGSK